MIDCIAAPAQFTGAEADTGIRQNCCHTLRHVAENTDGLKVVGRALVECGEVMLFILGPRPTADVLTSHLNSENEELCTCERLLAIV